jgi:hypothetical protein
MNTTPDSELEGLQCFPFHWPENVLSTEFGVPVAALEECFPACAKALEAKSLAANDRTAEELAALTGVHVSVIYSIWAHKAKGEESKAWRWSGDRIPKEDSREYQLTEYAVNFLLCELRWQTQREWAAVIRTDGISVEFVLLESQKNFKRSGPPMELAALGTMALPSFLGQHAFMIAYQWKHAKANENE